MILCDFIKQYKSTSLYSGFFLIFFLSVFIMSNTVNALPQPSGILIPLYTDPGNEWIKIMHTKIVHPSVSLLAIINPNNGPPPCPNDNYVKGINHLKSVGIFTLGYVSTNYTARNYTDVISDIYNWKKCYPNMDGIFFDEMSSTAGKESYYANLTSYAKSDGFAFTIGNPGKDTLPSYIGTVDNIVIYENSGLPDFTSFAGWHTKYNRDNFSIISYGVNHLNNFTINTISNHVGYFFITNGTLPNPFGSMPPYFGKMVKTLDKNMLMIQNDQ